MLTIFDRVHTFLPHFMEVTILHRKYTSGFRNLFHVYIFRTGAGVYSFQGNTASIDTGGIRIVNQVVLSVQPQQSHALIT